MIHLDPAPGVFSNFWNVSTFLLSDTYHYNPLEIGLFGLIGILGILCAPFVGRFIDRMLPWVTNLIALGIQVSSLRNRAVGRKRETDPGAWWSRSP